MEATLLPLSPGALAELIRPPARIVRRCTMRGYELLTEDQQWVLGHWSMFGSEGYPIVKRGSKWYVDGQRGIGATKSTYKTKRDATKQWEAYIGMLRDYQAGRISNPALNELS